MSFLKFQGVFCCASKFAWWCKSSFVLDCVIMYKNKRIKQVQYINRGWTASSLKNPAEGKTSTSGSINGKDGSWNWSKSRIIWTGSHGLSIIFPWHVEEIQPCRQEQYISVLSQAMERNPSIFYHDYQPSFWIWKMRLLATYEKDIFDSTMQRRHFLEIWSICHQLKSKQSSVNLLKSIFCQMKVYEIEYISLEETQV